MKYLCFILIICILFISCQNNQETNRKKAAKNFIEKEIKFIMKNKDSYKFISISDLIESQSSFKDSFEGKKLNDTLRHCEAEIIDYKIKFEELTAYPKKKRKEFKDSLLYYEDLKLKIENKLLEGKNNFKPEHDGYYATFCFEGSNSYGAVVVNEFFIKLNKDMTQIIYILDKKNNKLIKDSDKGYVYY